MFYTQQQLDKLYTIYIEHNLTLPFGRSQSSSSHTAGISFAFTNERYFEVLAFVPMLMMVVVVAVVVIVRQLSVADDDDVDAVGDAYGAAVQPSVAAAVVVAVLLYLSPLGFDAKPTLVVAVMIDHS